MRYLFIMIFLISCANKTIVDSKKTNEVENVEDSKKSISDSKIKKESCNSSSIENYKKFLVESRVDITKRNELLAKCYLKRGSPSKAVFYVNLNGENSHPKLRSAIYLRLKRFDLLFDLIDRSPSLRENENLVFLRNYYFSEFGAKPVSGTANELWRYMLNGQFDMARTILKSVGNSKSDLYAKLYFYYLTDKKMLSKTINKIRAMGISSDEAIYLKSIQTGKMK